MVEKKRSSSGLRWVGGWKWEAVGKGLRKEGKEGQVGRAGAGT